METPEMDLSLCDNRLLCTVCYAVGAGRSGSLQRRQHVVGPEYGPSLLAADRAPVVAQNDAGCTRRERGVTSLFTFLLCLHYLALAAKISWTLED